MSHELILVISKDLESATNKVVRSRRYDGIVPAGRFGVLFGLEDPASQTSSILAYMMRLQSMTEEGCTRPAAWFQQMHRLGGLIWDEIHKIVDALPPEQVDKCNRNGYFNLPKNLINCTCGVLGEQDNPFMKHPYIRYPGIDKSLFQKSWFFTCDPYLLDSKGKWLSYYDASEKEFFDQLWENILNVRTGMKIFILDGHY